MTQPIQANLIAHPAESLKSVHTREAQITVLAIGILSSLFCLMFLPWHISLPVSALLLGSSFIISWSLRNPVEWAAPPTVIVEEAPPQAVVVERYVSPPPVIIQPRPYFPSWQPTIHTPIFVEPRPVYPSWQPPYNGPMVQSRPVCPSWQPSYHAPVGTGERTAIYSQPSFAPSAPSHFSGAFNCGPRAPVGHR